MIERFKNEHFELSCSNCGSSSCYLKPQTLGDWCYLCSGCGQSVNHELIDKNRNGVFVAHTDFAGDIYLLKNGGIYEGENYLIADGKCFSCLGFGSVAYSPGYKTSAFVSFADDQIWLSATRVSFNSRVFDIFWFGEEYKEIVFQRLN